MELDHRVAIAAPAAEAWRVLGEGFGNICEWSATLTRSELDGERAAGGVRRCEGTGFGPFPAGIVTEELVAYDAERLHFAYVARSGLPPFVVHAGNAWTIEPRGPDACEVGFTATVRLAWWARPLGWLLPLVVRRDLARMSEEMRHRIETGRPHPRALPG